MVSGNLLRKSYLDFFAKKGHAIIPSASLLPANDPTTLFTGSGMQPMLPFLLGEKHPLGSRITDSQKSFRAVDIDEVGDNRHTTFFEMLGNWSLGDYFKREQITWMYEFLTKEVGLAPERLFITCFRGNTDLHIPKDEEAAGLWQAQFGKDGVRADIADFPEKFGMQGARIFYYDEKKNWWSRGGVPGNMPVGEPGGPDTEMFWDFAPARGDAHLQDVDIEQFGQFCHVNCDCGRFMEIGNNVFMEYIKTEQGFEFLPQKNVDFGGGLERVAAARMDTPDVFLIDLFASQRDVIARVSGKVYGENAAHTRAYRVILDHIRASTFLIADGALPGNKDQGYFTRRMIRRAVRFGRDLDIHTSFTADVAGAVVDTYKEAYPELEEKREEIVSEMEKEETKFRKTLEQGMKEFEKVVAVSLEAGIVAGKPAFDLLQSYGFPIELTEELAVEKGLKVDMASFLEEKQKHQELSRSASEQKFKGGLSDHSDISVKYHTATHLLHAALRAVLGDHVLQRGSNITPERLRFDFTHTGKMSAEEIAKVEELVNAAITKDYPVSFQELPLEEARKLQAIGLFGEKYPDVVKVYTVGDVTGLPVASAESPTFSREFCGGPHVERTGVIGKFKITKEEAVSAGVRRIKAVVS